MSAEEVPSSPEKRRRRAVPRGVILLGLLLYAGAFVLLATAVVLGTAQMNGVPRWVPLLGALVLVVLATGLFRRRRWAWFSMLAFVGVSAFYLLRATAERGQNSIVGLTILAVIAGYLLGPGVRMVYLKGDPHR